MVEKTATAPKKDYHQLGKIFHLQKAEKHQLLAQPNTKAQVIQELGAGESLYLLGAWEKYNYVRTPSGTTGFMAGDLP